jgi:hypothetical protein
MEEETEKKEPEAQPTPAEQVPAPAQPEAAPQQPAPAQEQKTEPPTGKPGEEEAPELPEKSDAEVSEEKEEA